MRGLHQGAYFLAEWLTGRKVSRYLAELRRHDAMSRRQIEQIQRRRLNSMLEYAHERIPYYRERLHSGQEIRRLPFLTKEEILSDPSRFWPQGEEKKHLRRSGGSTGERMPIYYDAEGLDRTAAMQIRMMEWCGKQPGEREVHFASTTVQQMSGKEKMREWAKAFALNRHNLFVDLFDDARYAEIIRQLSASRPKVVQGYPSIAFQLACYAERVGQECKNLFPALEVEGETLHDFQRQKIEQVFGCKVFNRYGNAEFGIIAHECSRHDGLHIRSDMFLVETLPLDLPLEGPDGVATDLQEIVVTGLTNRGMPLFRYRTGDLGILEERPCECGLPYPRLRQVTGRVHELIDLEGLGQVATYVILNSLERLAWVRNFQIAQTKSGVRVYLLLGADFQLDALQEVQATIWQNNRLGKYRLDFEIVDKLAISPRGKFRYIIEDPGLAPERRILRQTEMGEIADARGKREE